MDLNQKILERFNLKPSKEMPIAIPDFGRNDLAVLFADLGFTTGAEIGVECGKYSEVLCKKIPNLHLYCVDAWKAYKGYRDHVYQDKLDRFYETTKEVLSPYNATLIRKFSMDAVKDIPDNSLDFVYIDCNHEFQNVTNDICEWSKKVKIGGIVSGHDYFEFLPHRLIHVFEVVNAYTMAYKINPWFVTGAKEKVEGQTRDKVRSWFWVKK